LGLLLGEKGSVKDWKMKILTVIAPHEEGYKAMQKEKRQTKFTSFYTKSSVCPIRPCYPLGAGSLEQGSAKKNVSKRHQKKKSCLFIINLFVIIFHLLLVSLAPIFSLPHLKFAHFSRTYPLLTTRYACSA